MTAFIYIVNRIFYRFVDFWRHWYVGSFKIAGHILLSLLEKIDKRIALKITLKNFFQPLYQDRSFIGYCLGFIFRTIRLFFGGVSYLFIIILGLSIYLFWLAIPLLIIFEIIKDINSKL